MSIQYPGYSRIWAVYLLSNALMLLATYLYLAQPMNSAHVYKFLLN